MKILCISYRDWALKIYDELAKTNEHEVIIIRNKDDYSDELVLQHNANLILFYGWSWIISDQVLNSTPCIMLHPSPLPKYRGGSPIQNQIINGEKTSCVTLFLMDDTLDGGDIVAQEEISFEGHLDQIFNRMSEIGWKLTQQLLAHGISGQKQDESQATYCKRRKPADSEITIKELQSQSSEYLFNKIRMLEDPYPNAFIRTIDGKKLLIKFAELE